VEDEAGLQRKVLWWQGARGFLPEGKFDLAFVLRASNFRGQREVQMEWRDFRQMETPVGVELVRSEIGVLDLRAETDPLAALTQLQMKNPGLEIWSEGNPRVTPPVTAANRTRLQPADMLAIWTIPPSRNDLLAVLQVVKPGQVVLLGVPAGEDTPRELLTRITGLVRYAARNRQGQVQLNELAAMCCHRRAAVQAALEWLVGKGYMRIEERSGDTWRILEGGVPNAELAAAAETMLAAVLEETAAYRAYYLRAPARNILHEGK